MHDLTITILHKELPNENILVVTELYLPDPTTNIKMMSSDLNQYYVHFGW